jgi:hypothetical protein
MSNAPLPENFSDVVRIQSVQDVLTIVNPRFKNGRPILDRRNPLFEILDKRSHGKRQIISRDAPLGLSESRTPRLFSQGIWFRGDQDSDRPVIPSAHEIFETQGQAFDEKNAFIDMKLRMSREDLSQLNTFELLCKMRHHGFPARILDWSANPLIGLYFAVSTRPGANDTEKDGVFTCINAYRLNAISCITRNRDPGIFYPDSANVAIRALMTEHTLLIDVIERMKRIIDSNNSKFNKRVSDLIVDLEILERIILRERQKKAQTQRHWKDIRKSNDDEQVGSQYYENFQTETDVRAEARQAIEEIIHSVVKENPSSVNFSEITEKNVIRIASQLVKLAYPVAVIPKRDSPRMTAQLSMFTLHGGKRFFDHQNSFVSSCYDELEKLLLENDLLIRGPQNGIDDQDTLDSVDRLPRNLDAMIKHDDVSRICAELERFTHNHKIFQPVSLDTLNTYAKEKFLLHFYIDAKCKKKIREELDQMSINGASLFPEMDNQVDYVRNRWTTKLD